jgi:hypothetical protein
MLVGGVGTPFTTMNFMWVAFTFVGYLLLALLLPVAWASWHTWRRAQVSRMVICPVTKGQARISLDPWYSMHMHALGEQEKRVLDCPCWPEHRKCRQECLAQLSA